MFCLILCNCWFFAIGFCKSPSFALHTTPNLSLKSSPSQTSKSNKNIDFLLAFHPTQSLLQKNQSTADILYSIISDRYWDDLFPLEKETNLLIEPISASINKLVKIHCNNNPKWDEDDDKVLLKMGGQDNKEPNLSILYTHKWTKNNESAIEPPINHIHLHQQHLDKIFLPCCWHLKPIQQKIEKGSKDGEIRKCIENVFKPFSQHMIPS